MTGAESLLPPHLQQPRTAPPGLVLQLREIDKTAELVNICEGVWWLGCVRPNEAKRLRSAHALHRMLGTRNAPAGRVLRAMLGEYGFTFIAEYRIEGEPTSAIVADFRERDYLWRHRPDETFEERLNEYDREKEVAKADRLDEIRVGGKDAFEFALKNPHSVGMKAPPTPSRIITDG